MSSFRNPVRIALLAPVVAGLAGAALPAASPAPGPGPTPVPLEGTTAANWPGWRGPGGTGVSAARGVPLSWDSPDELLWTAEIRGRAHSSPIVWEDRVYLTTAIEGEAIPGASAVPHFENGEPFRHPDSLGGDRSHAFRLLALDADTGETLWERTVYEGRVHDDRHRSGSYAAPTPLTDGERIYSYFGSEGLYAHDLQGEPVWQVDLGDIATWGMGVGASPVLWGELLIIQADEDGGEASFVVAVDRRTGREVWRRSRPVQASWSTPVVAEGGGRQELITSGNEHVIAYDPATGEELWRVDGVHSNAIATPLWMPGMAIVSAGFPRKVTMGIHLGPDGSFEGGRVAWTYEKGTAYVASNLLYEDYLYLVSDKGILTCLEPRTGELVYEGGRVPAPGNFTASPVGVDGKILLASTDGDVFVIRAGDEHEVLAHSRVDEPIWASPAIAGDRLYVRGERHLYAIGD